MGDADHEWPAFRAMLRLRSTEDGGRARGVVDGFRAGWLVLHRTGEITYNDGSIGGLSGSVLAPGEASEVLIFPFVPELWPWTDIWTGRDVVMMEGATVIGIARVLGRTMARLDNPPEGQDLPSHD
jgi:hypothetical protein